MYRYLIGIFYFFGLYKKLWQYASIGELAAIMGAVTVGAAAIIAYTYFVMAPVLPMPRSVFSADMVIKYGFPLAVLAWPGVCSKITPRQPRGGSRF